MRILVTGATGRVGGRVVQRLLEEPDGHQVFAVVRDRAAALPAGVEPVPADLTDPGSLGALRPADAAFLLFPSIAGDPAAPRVVSAVADSVRGAGGRIVYQSAHGADSAAGQGGIMGSHTLLEGLIRETGVPWTFLRSSGFAANTLGWADSIRATGTVRWPAADARRALIHEDDLAAVAVQSLTGAGDRTAAGGDQIATGDQTRTGTPGDRTPGGAAGRAASAPGQQHQAQPNQAQRNQALHLTGPEQLTQREYAEHIGEVIGRPVAYVELSQQQAMSELFAGLPESFARSIIDGQRAMIDNPEPVTDTVAELLGRPAQPFTRWVADHRAAFAG
ncbi:NAD(P)H-binding protein [Nakamurella aerolata]|uniref:NAD(P)H-binding protein n=1 Tax=Nakamurella aerolata TaxID=1656892 RepID=A0A849A6F5_9ACTN|nr:NAD(P)H-binding protein [Nakamurella aerolata]NNG36139.1 NAD(P)H-binding protein [Nakamurella aerolata]